MNVSSTPCFKSSAIQDAPEDARSGNDELEVPLAAPVAASYYKKSNTLYSIPKSGYSNPMIIKDLDITIYPYKTLKAKYLLKFQTSNSAYAPSFGFVGINQSTDSLMGTAFWATSTGGTSTIYSFMTDNPRFYSNNVAGVTDSNVPFPGIDSKGTFTTINIEIEYYNGGRNAATLSLEFNRDLYRWPGQTQQIIEGSSVEYRFI